MPSLSETQAGIRAASAGDASGPLMQSIRAPANPEDRLEIYRRHHRESFRRHLRGRYPTVEWLLGTDRFVQLADITLQRRPPRAPSMAEYGAQLIDVISTGGENLPPYLADVARLDWHLGSVSVALARQPLAITSLAGIDPLHVAQMPFSLQPGLAFVASDWPIDELFHVRLRQSQPESLAFDRRATYLQLRGARGEFTLANIAPGTFAFRASLAGGDTLATAAALGAEAESDFDLPGALATLFAEGLVINHSGENAHV